MLFPLTLNLSLSYNAIGVLKLLLSVSGFVFLGTYGSL